MDVSVIWSSVPKGLKKGPVSCQPKSTLGAGVMDRAGGCHGQPKFDPPLAV